MKSILSILIGVLLCQSINAQQLTELIKKNLYNDYKGMFRPARGVLKYPFITPGSDQYANDLWDWDSWLTNIALRQILTDKGNTREQKEALAYERGCILNFLDYGGADGYIPIVVWKNANPREQMPKDIYKENMHKPVLAQHAAFLVKQDQGNAEWLREKFYFMQAFMTNYKMHHRNKATGLYYWQNDVAIGVDNDPSTFFRPPGSSASIYLNCLMYKELQAMVYLAKCLNQLEVAHEFDQDAIALKEAVQKNCWDERDGFFYSVDLNLMPIFEVPRRILGLDMVIHSGFPRSYDCLIQRIGSWSGFLAMWSGIASPEQAKRMVSEHYKNEKTFNAPYGVRSLSKLEKMYSVRASGNPSNWLGPVWGISNYLVYKGLVKYGFRSEATELANKTIQLFGKDIQKHGALHEYYEPDSGEPILNKGFQNWNYLVLNIMAQEEGRPVIEEF
ncbi:Glycosyl hydrolase family 63 C-terminal domain-containing protein [Pedobacter sp. ok626]|uniref:MGH1-like glycoside hydrolase domain-containing protein n=1 Tax=Pedobacter sp. ok626 TaxID=1761882 RepID=UPI000884AE8F|nr:trehalase family glycosidase [Pedobacter sp. ok626]SDL35561.1 Glycosyl hydrolase family 63 C-terminal domain-containing protein [Pedobacter sp. ok626]